MSTHRSVSTKVATRPPHRTTRSLDKTVYEDGFQSKTFEVEHTRYDGPLGTCVATYKLAIVDYEVVVDKWLGPGCR